MKKLLFLILPLSIVIGACKPSKIQEGEIEYAISYPHSEISGFMQAILPETMTITMKGTKIKTTIARGEIFTTEIISDEATKSVEMRLDFGDKLYYTELDENEIKLLIDSQPTYDVTPLNAQDSLINLLSNSYAVACSKDTIPREDAWFTEDLAPTNAYWFTSYAAVKGLPLIYDAERYGVMMHLEAVNFTEREVTDKEFERAKNLDKVSFEDYESEVQELFDILME